MEEAAEAEEEETVAEVLKPPIIVMLSAIWMNKNVLSLVEGSSSKDAWITIESDTFEGYQFVKGAVGRQKVTSDIPEREYSGYTVEDGQRTSLKLDLDETTVTIYVKATEGNQVCDVEIRPMYVVEQAY